jgi:hypothetical protein
VLVVYGTSPFTAAHEIMHILLNETHVSPQRDDEPVTALYYPDAIYNNNTSDPKRIGPYPDAAHTGVGNGDTQAMRENVESLPQ